jgi:DNA-binding PadR family transcriptional regulator
MTIHQAILSVMARSGTGMRRCDIRDGVIDLGHGWKPDSINSCFERLKADGLIERVLSPQGEGVWQLTETGRAQEAPVLPPAEATEDEYDDDYLEVGAGGNAPMPVITAGTAAYEAWVSRDWAKKLERLEGRLVRKIADVEEKLAGVEAWQEKATGQLSGVDVAAMKGLAEWRGVIDDQLRSIEGYTEHHQDRRVEDLGERVGDLGERVQDLRLVQRLADLEEKLADVEAWQEKAAGQIAALAKLVASWSDWAKAHERQGGEMIAEIRRRLDWRRWAADALEGVAERLRGEGE